MKRPIFPCSLFRNVVLHSFLNVTVCAAGVFFRVNFMACLHLFDGVLDTFRRFIKLNYAFIFVLDFEKFSS